MKKTCHMCYTFLILQWQSLIYVKKYHYTLFQAGEASRNIILNHVPLMTDVPLRRPVHA